MDAFQVVMKLGIYCWDPTVLTKKDMSDVDVEDIEKGLHMRDLQPSKLVGFDPSMQFSDPRSLAQPRVLNVFPHDAGYIVPLHIACARHGIDVDSIDFVFGGSTLHVLAEKHIDRRDAHDDTKYLVQRVPGTLKAKLVCKHKVYTQNYADIGFQFERLMTGESVRSVHDMRKFEHLQVVDLAGKTILFAAEVDAVDSDGSPVELKSGNPRYFGTKVLLQMMSSGAEKLVFADKRQQTLLGVKVKKKREMLHEASSQLRVLQANIIDGLLELERQEQHFDVVMEMDFRRDGSMSLSPLSSNIALLPAREVVDRLLSPNR